MSGDTHMQAHEARDFAPSNAYNHTNDAPFKGFGTSANQGLQSYALPPAPDFNGMSVAIQRAYKYLNDLKQSFLVSATHLEQAQQILGRYVKSYKNVVLGRKTQEQRLIQELHVYIRNNPYSYWHKMKLQETQHTLCKLSGYEDDPLLSSASMAAPVHHTPTTGHAITLPAPNDSITIVASPEYKAMILKDFTRRTNMFISWSLSDNRKIEIKYGTIRELLQAFSHCTSSLSTASPNEVIQLAKRIIAEEALFTGMIKAQEKFTVDHCTWLAEFVKENPSYEERVLDYLAELHNDLDLGPETGHNSGSVYESALCKRTIHELDKEMLSFTKTFNLFRSVMTLWEKTWGKELDAERAEREGQSCLSE